MDLYKLLLGAGLILLALLLVVYQNNNGAFSKGHKYTQNDVRLFFATGIGLILGLYYLIGSF
jgi:uncharacterized membrane protein YidH (DUF202 family)